MKSFRWRDGERTIRFGDGVLAASAELLAEHGFEEFDLLCTERSLAGAPASLREAAGQVLNVPSGQVPDISAPLVDEVGERGLVALGGGRVVDAAKAIAAVRGLEVAAIPTTLSAAEMTTIHRLPAGRESEAKGLVRAVLVLADPDAMSGQDETALRASAMNALSHGGDSLVTPFANPMSEMAALRGAELIATALDADPSDRDRGGLALGALLCGYAIDSAGLALHHVVCQTLVRVLEIPHAETNATMLPHTMAALVRRAPEPMQRFAEALGTTTEGLAGRIAALGGGPRRLSEIGAEEARIDDALDGIEARPDLQTMTPDPPDRDQLRALLEAAW